MLINIKPICKAVLLVSIVFLVAACESTPPPSKAASKLAGHAVATAHPLATQSALDILDRGGNAFDAAIAASAVLAVVEPSGSGIGGGGFWLLHRESDGMQVMVDGREMAPMAADKDMYLDDKRNVINGASLNGPLAAAIPGQIAALVHMNERYGRLSLKQNLQAAIDYAANGFVVTKHIKRHITFRSKVFNDEAKRLFLVDGKVPELGHIIVQPELAQTLQLVARKGRAGFYEGNVAKKMVQSVRENGGIWTLEDLKNYQVVEREPMTFNYRGAKIITASLPSSGGVVLGQMLQTIELKQEEAKKQQNTAKPGLAVDRSRQAPSMHLVVEAMRRAYRDRAIYLGDPDFVKVDQKELLSKTYLQGFSGAIGENATKSVDLPIETKLGVDTTHFSIIDRDGNRVAATLSINYPFGSGHIAKGTGVFLNNEMDDFVSKVGAPNVYGLVGGKANQIAPRKRPLSSMTPTFVETEEGAIVIGTPGGSRIISMVGLAIINLLDRNMDLQSAVNAPRFHHQYLPDTVQLEDGANYSEIKDMQARGHQFKRLKRRYGNMHAVSWLKKDGFVYLDAASDARGEGQASVR